MKQPSKIAKNVKTPATSPIKAVVVNAVGLIVIVGAIAGVALYWPQIQKSVDDVVKSLSSGGFSPGTNFQASAGGMSQSEIETIEKQIAESFVNSFSKSSPRVSCNSNGSSCTMNLSINSGTNCSTGGRMFTTGSTSGSATQTQAYFSFGARQTISDWRCVGDWVVNGDPYINYTGTVYNTGSHVSFDFHQGNGWKATNPSGGKQSCQRNMRFTYSSSTGYRITGTLTCVPGGQISYSRSF